jgi:hypothetical protein
VLFPTKKAAAGEQRPGRKEGSKSEGWLARFNQATLWGQSTVTNTLLSSDGGSRGRMERIEEGRNDHKREIEIEIEIEIERGKEKGGVRGRQTDE